MLDAQLSEEQLLKREAELLKRHPAPKSKIFLPTEKYNLRDRVEGIAKVVDLYENRLDAHKARLREIRTQFAGKKRCFIIGNGPSLNDTDLTKLKDEYTFGLNGIFLMYDQLPFRPTFYLVEDHLVAEDRAPSINQLTDSIRLFPGYLAYCIEEKPGVTFFHHRGRSNFKLGNYDFSTDASDCTYAGCTVTFTAIQLAFYFGFKEIYLIGVDSNYDIPTDVAVSTGTYSVQTLDMKSDDPNHFHPDYFGKGFRWHDPQVDRMIAAYEKARDVALTHGVRVINATKGGKLESFPRVDYDSLFDGKSSEDLLSKSHPRTFVVDLTSIGGNSATGQFKQALFGGWPQSELAQVFKEGQKYRVQLPGYAPQVVEQGEIIKFIRAFHPDVIYCRPVEQCPELLDILLTLSEEDGIPTVVHMMDDWPERMRIENPDIYPEVDRQLRLLLTSAAANLSICDAMSLAFKERYGVDFMPIANGIDPREWPDIERQKKETFVLRYCGGLATDMGRDMVFAVAALVDRINLESGNKLSFEIYTMKAYMKEAAEQLSSYRGVSVKLLVPRDEYPRLLIDADFLLIAYNDDERSVRYTRYSMANKLPDCFASGSPVIALGPDEIATIAYLKKTGCGLAAATIQEFEVHLRALMADPERKTRIGRAARCYVFQNHHINKISEQFRSVLSRALTDGQFKTDYLMGPFSRSRHFFFDEAACISEIAGEEAGVFIVKRLAGAQIPLDQQIADLLQEGHQIHISQWFGPPDKPSRRWRGLARYTPKLTHISPAESVIAITSKFSEEDWLKTVSKHVREEKTSTAETDKLVSRAASAGRLPMKLGAPVISAGFALSTLGFALLGFSLSGQASTTLLFALIGALLAGFAALTFVLGREIVLLKNKNKAMAEILDRKVRRLQEIEAKFGESRSRGTKLEESIRSTNKRMQLLEQSLAHSLSQHSRDVLRLEKQISTERSERIAEFAHRDGGNVIPSHILLLVTLHRCGSTWLFDMLRCHPALVLNPSYMIYEALGLIGGRYPLGLSNGPEANMLFENQAGVGTKIPKAPAKLQSNVETFALEKIHPAFFQDNAEHLLESVAALEAKGHRIKLIYQVRDPVATLASFQSYQRRSPGWYEQVGPEQLIPFMLRAYETIETLSGIRPGLIVDYSDLKSKPVETLQKIYTSIWQEAPGDGFREIAQQSVDSTNREDRRQKQNTAFLGEIEGGAEATTSEEAPAYQELYAVYRRILAGR